MQTCVADIQGGRTTETHNVYSCKIYAREHRSASLSAPAEHPIANIALIFVRAPYGALALRRSEAPPARSLVLSATLDDGKAC